MLLIYKFSNYKLLNFWFWFVFLTTWWIRVLKSLFLGGFFFLFFPPTLANISSSWAAMLYKLFSISLLSGVEFMGVSTFCKLPTVSSPFHIILYCHLIKCCYTNSKFNNHFKQAVSTTLVYTTCSEPNLWPSQLMISWSAVDRFFHEFHESVNWSKKSRKQSKYQTFICCWQKKKITCQVYGGSCVVWVIFYP